ncbi:kynureninase [Saccharopolyspora cebuensis]
MDDADDLASLRAHYRLPPGVIHLDGGAGGPQPRTTPARLRRFVDHRPEPRARRGDGECRREARGAATALAPLIGAAPEEITFGEPSITLFKALLAAARLRPHRRILALGRNCFAGDHYVAESAARFTGCTLHLLDHVDELADLPADQVVIVALAHTDPTGAVRDAAALTSAIRERDALALWDLSYSAGALDVDLDAWGVDFAIGAGHRFLGGGAGAPSYCFVADRHRARTRVCGGGVVLHPLSSGFGDPSSALPLAELHAGLSVLRDVPPAALAAKTRGLVSLFLRRLDEHCPDAGIDVVPTPPGMPRGAQVLLRHPHAQRLGDALYNRGVLVEGVEPDRLRFSFAPSWLRHVDVWEATDELHGALHDVAAVSPPRR